MNNKTYKAGQPPPPPPPPPPLPPSQPTPSDQGKPTVSFSIIATALGNCSRSLLLLPSSKSSNSKPGDTVQPKKYRVYRVYRVYSVYSV